MPQQDHKSPPLLEDLERHYLSGTKPQEALPFSIRVRRMYKWWPGAESHGRLIDRIILMVLVAPGILWLAFFFGWVPVLFVLAELIVLRLTVYRVMKGTLFD